jgi:hypothetical protein
LNIGVVKERFPFSIRASIADIRLACPNRLNSLPSPDARFVAVENVVIAKRLRDW